MKREVERVGAPTSRWRRGATAGPSRTSGFDGARAKVQFALFCAATFLLYASFSQTALLAIVLAQHQVPTGAEARILSAYGLAVVVTAWSIGGLLRKYGPKKAVLLGASIQIVAFVSYEFTLLHPAWGIASRLLQGVGHGLFFASSMLLAQSYLSKERMVYFLGVFAMMLPLPFAIGPYLGQLYLETAGTGSFFLITAVPAMIGLLFLLALDAPGARTRESSVNRVRIAELLSNHPYLSSCSAIFAAGLAFGYVTIYIAQVIYQRDGSIFAFFLMFPVSLFIFRFFVLQKADRLPKYRLGMAGLFCMALSFAVCFASANVYALLLAGSLYGAGHSMVFPALNAIVATEYEAERRALPVTLINAVFNTGIFVAPLLVFALSAWLSKMQVLLVVAVLCVVGALILRVPFVRRAAGVAG